jgi:DNA gyrase subunit A
MAIRFNEEDVRLMVRPPAGVKGIELEEGDRVIGVVATFHWTSAPTGETVTRDPSLCLLTITERGYGKRTPIDEYRVQPEGGARSLAQSRGGKGLRRHQDPANATVIPSPPWAFSPPMMSS